MNRLIVKFSITQRKKEKHQNFYIKYNLAVKKTAAEKEHNQNRKKVTLYFDSNSFVDFFNSKNINTHDEPLVCIENMILE